MNLKTIIGTFVVGMLLVSCTHSDNRLTVNVSQEVVTSGYIGNGVEGTLTMKPSHGEPPFLTKTGRNCLNALTLCVWAMCVV